MTSTRRGLLFLAVVAFTIVAFKLPAQQAVITPPQQETGLQIPATDVGLPGAGPIRRADWFQSVWMQRRSLWADRTEQDQQALVFLGDSITQGWGDDMGQSFPGVKVANRGISGDTTRGMLIRLEQDVLSLDPSGVVLLMGTNDLEEQATPETIAEESPTDSRQTETTRRENANRPLSGFSEFRDETAAGGQDSTAQSALRRRS